jgi:hypothetical protein
MAHQAQDNFVAEIDGAPLTVVKGQVFPSSHPVVKLDGDRGLLFRPLDIDQDAPRRGVKPGAAAKADS